MTVKNQRGVTLIEVLIGMVLIVVISLGSFVMFSSGLGHMKLSGDRRGALEAARAQLEKIVSANLGDIAPPANGDLRYVDCSVDPCTLSAAPVTENVTITNLGNRRMETTVQRIDDPAAGTLLTLDTIEISVKVWFTPFIGNNNDANRVEIRSLRTP